MLTYGHKSHIECLSCEMFKLSFSLVRAGRQTPVKVVLNSLSLYVVRGSAGGR